MITEREFTEVNRMLMRDYGTRGDERFGIAHLVEFGNSIVVFFTREYRSTLGEKPLVREGRVAIFRIEFTGKGQTKLQKSSDMIADGAL